MSTMFPLRSAVEVEDRDPRLVDIEEETADDVFEALSSRTTRRIFSALHDEPRTASDLVDVTDTSVQNVQYHLGKLQDADLIEEVDTWYSERGTEMSVYAPTDEALVLFAGEEKQRSLRSLLKRVVSAVGLLGFVSTLVFVVTDRLVAYPTPEPSSQPQSGPGIMGTGGESAADAAQSGAAGSLDPALLAALACFVGGLLVLCAIGAVWYWTQRTEQMARQASA